MKKVVYMLQTGIIVKTATLRHTKNKVFCLADFLFLELATEIETMYWKERNCHHIAQSKTCNFNEQGNS